MAQLQKSFSIYLIIDKVMDVRKDHVIQAWEVQEYGISEISLSFIIYPFLLEKEVPIKWKS